MSWQSGTDLIVWQSLSIDTISFEIEDRNSEDRWYFAVNSLIRISEDKTDIKSGEVELSCKDCLCEYCKEISAWHADICCFIGVVINNHWQFSRSRDLIPYFSIFLREVNDQTNSWILGNWEWSSIFSIEHECIVACCIIFVIVKGDFLNLHI